jgi:hypothetical protein
MPFKTKKYMKYCLLLMALCVTSGIQAQEANDSTVKQQKLSEVVVTSAQSASKRMKEVQIGVEKIDIGKMTQIPTLFGEKDILKSIQMLPGVKAEGEGSCGFQVRGGTAAQNLVMIDNAPIYNPGHFVGLFSAFNDEAIQTASLYKGQIPAMFGGATSSVLDVASKAGDMGNWHAGVSIGLLASKIEVDGPIVKDKVSMLFSARRSYLDLFLKLSEKYRENTMNFYDVNFRTDFDVSPVSKMFVSFYTGKDNMEIDDLAEMRWGNMSASGGWKYILGEKLRFNTTLSYNIYKSRVGTNVTHLDKRMDGHVKQTILKENIDWQASSNHAVSVGAQAAYDDVISADWQCLTVREKEQRYGTEIACWVNDDWKVAKWLEMSLGVRYNNFKKYDAIEPRASMKFNLNELHCIKGGYSRSAQNIHAIRNSSTSLPMDRYTLSTDFIKPEKADQVSLGYFGMTKEGDYDFSIEGYYKWVNDIYDYKDGKNFESDIAIENIILGGKGRAYGMELSAHKNNGRLTGWLSYTLSWSENKIDGINGNRWYTANNDRRHDVNLVGMYQLNDFWNVSASFVFNSGQALTAPSAKYQIDGNTVYYYSERNGYRAPSSHHLDLSATYSKKLKRCERQWAFGIYNIYNRENPYVITFSEDDESASGTKATQTALFGAIPFVSFTLRY